jgi:DNA-binding winged helix-turn-helix (wHTH) protein
VRFAFGDFALDTGRRELTRGSEQIPVGPKVFDLLVYLIENRERVVSKDELLEVVWGGRVVSESTMASHINAVRKAVGDTERKFVRTLARKGFRFVGEVTTGQSPADEMASMPAVGVTTKAPNRRFPTSRRLPCYPSRTGRAIPSRNTLPRASPTTS